MTDVKPSSILVSFILFTLIIVSGINMVNILGDSNSAITSRDDYSEFNQSFNKLKEIDSTVDGLKVQAERGSEETGTFGFLDSLIGGSWGTLTALFESLSFIQELVQGLNSYFKVDPIIITIAGLIISTIIIFAILGAIFQRRL